MLLDLKRFLARCDECGASYWTFWFCCRVKCSRRLHLLTAEFIFAQTVRDFWQAAPACLGSMWLVRLHQGRLGIDLACRFPTAAWTMPKAQQSHDNEALNQVGGVWSIILWPPGAVFLATGGTLSLLSSFVPAPELLRVGRARHCAPKMDAKQAAALPCSEADTKGLISTKFLSQCFQQNMHAGRYRAKSATTPTAPFQDIHSSRR